MIVPFVAAGVSFAYLTAVPIKLAFALRAGEKPGYGAGIAVFEGRYASRAALKRMSGEKKHFPHKKITINIEKIELIKSALRAARYILRHTSLDALDVRARLGLGDAALTAMSCGAVSSLVCALSAATGAALSADVRPDFAARTLVGEISGMVTLRVGHIMLAALIGAYDYGNGRLSKWIDTRSKTS